MHSRPRIGISTSFSGEEQQLALPYVRAVEEAGGLPLPVPMLREAEAMSEFVDLLDGLILTGGPAISQGLVGHLPEDISATDPVRETADRLLLEHAIPRRIPVLGICYGMQLISALRGGTILADAQAQISGCGIHSEKRGGTEHPLQILPDTHLNRLLGKTEMVVNTRHIQAIAEPGTGLRVSAVAPDGVVEAVESLDGRFIGVQFHPERMGAGGLPLFRHLTALALEYREQLSPTTA